MDFRFKKTAAAAVLVLLFAALIGGCGSAGSEKGAAEQNGDRAVITDMLGRKVEVSIPAERLAAIGPGALRLVCYAGGAEKVVGIENFEKQRSAGRPYILAYPELKNLPTIGQGGPDSAPDVEKLAAVKPDVIFAAYLLDKSRADELQAKTGIPVVVLSYGEKVPFDEDIYESLKLIGRVIGSEKRAEEVVKYLKKCREDLIERTRGIPEDEKPRVYVGALGMKGFHGIESTAAEYGPFDAVGVVNVVDETGSSGSIMIEKEKLLSWDPDIIFIDEGGLHLVRDDYRKNKKFYQSLKAFNNGRVYGQIPFNYYAANIDTAVADAYFVGKVVFPEQFKDVDPIKKADEIYSFMLGKPLYDQMAGDFGGFKKITFSDLE
ncbi:MAG TPA: hypothetical protein DEA47_04735 [Peptococcaceae bacterium]|nr:MAG: ABC transporter, periplasmic binding protein [Clostridia bacterium 41_269]HBT20651.1 hypothetical protein [Peptococcaceae bacterium]